MMKYTLVLWLVAVTFESVHGQVASGTIKGRRTFDQMEEIKRDMFDDKIPEWVEDYGHKFIMEYHGGEKKARQLGHLFGFTFEKKMFDDVYIFSKEGVANSSVYKFPVHLPSMRRLLNDKMLISMKQTTHVPGDINLEIVSPHDKIDTPRDKRDTPRDKTDIPRDKRDTSRDKRDTSLDKIHTPRDQRDTPRDKIDISRDKRNVDNLTSEDFGVQWYFRENQTMGVYEAWQRGYTGKGIVVSLAADGVQMDHPDLRNTFNESISYDYMLDIPGGWFVDDVEYFGTLLAGIMGAEDNDICVTGVAYNATFASLRVSSTNHYLSDYSMSQALIHHLDIVDINAKFWSYDRYGIHYIKFTILEQSAIEKGIREGRGGKGLIYVTGTLLNKYQEDCNTDPYAKSIHTILVNPIFGDGTIMEVAEQCSCVMVAAFGAMRSNQNEYENMRSTYIGGDCTEIFGPAIATATVSAIIALALEANYELTYRDIQHMLIETSTPDFITNGEFIINGAGKKVSHIVGFGLVNASAMVEAAETWKTVPDIIACSGPRETVRICCKDELKANFTVEDCHVNYVEHVEVWVYFRVTWREYTEIHLISPRGTDNRIMRQRPRDRVTGDKEYTFTSVQNWGEDPRGNWTIMLKNLYPCENMMFIYSWSLKIYGTVTDPLLGIPENGTLGGHATNTTPCENGTYPLIDVNLCIYCDLNGYRVVDDVCAKDGRSGGYCDDTIPCTDAAWCNDSKCQQCPFGYHGYSGVCIEDGTLDGYCDGNIVCDLDPPNMGCNETTLRCVECIQGWHIITGLCVQDGMMFGYCDVDTPCTHVIVLNYQVVDVGCILGINRCDTCHSYANHSLVDGFCREDGLLDGMCNRLLPCTEVGVGCNETTTRCVDCSMTGYRTWNGFCRQDRIFDGYCDKHALCIDGSSCYAPLSTCRNCFDGHRVLGGFCMKDGHFGGYCSKNNPCVTTGATCLLDVNICVNCMEPNYVEHGFCITGDVGDTSDGDVDDGSTVGELAGIGIGSVVLGILTTVAGFTLLARRFFIPKIQPGSSHSSARIIQVSESK